MKYLLFAMLLCLPSLVKGQAVDLLYTADMPNSGNDFLRICEASIHGDTSGPGGRVIDLACSAYVRGVWDGLYIYGRISNVELYDLSIGSTIPLGQVEQIVVKYMNDHRKELNKRTAELVLMALQDSYPPKKNPR
jgi:hypothetical protein